MKFLKKRVKGLVYNNCPIIIIEIALITIASIMAIIGCFTNEIMLEAIIPYALLVVTSIIILIHRYHMRKANKDWRCLSCSFSLIRPGCVWINMDVKSKKKDENLKDQFKEEVDALLNGDFIPKGSVCYFITHDIVLDRIRELYPDAKAEPLYRKNIARLRKSLLPEEKAKEVYKDIRLFYAVKLIK